MLISHQILDAIYVVILQKLYIFASTFAVNNSSSAECKQSTLVGIGGNFSLANRQTYPKFGHAH